MTSGLRHAPPPLSRGGEEHCPCLTVMALNTPLKALASSGTQSLFKWIFAVVVGGKERREGTALRAETMCQFVMEHSADAVLVGASINNMR